jgi:hypothetical protein
MVRLGILRGKGKKLFSAAKFKEDYWLLGPNQIMNIHDYITRMFRTLPHGPFMAVTYLVGEAQARRLAMEGHLVMLDSYLNESSMAESRAGSPMKLSSPKKRKIRDRSDDDIDED